VFLKSLFKNKGTATTDLSWLGTDIHSHLLPGIDDGAPDLATSLELLKGLADLGYKKVVTTPHVFWEMYPNTSEIIGEKEQLLKSAAAEAGIEVAFSAAAEYFIDGHFAQQLADKKPLRTVHDNMVLVEFSMLTAPMDLQDVLFQMQLQGYQPLIAHPERYTYLSHRPAFFDELKNSGCLFQLNLLSLTPHYGTSVQALAEYLLKQNLYDYAGTDLHRDKHLQALKTLAASPMYARLKNSTQLKNHLL
jgi:tyrosine-protein phosphatase YwqE